MQHPGDRCSHAYQRSGHGNWKHCYAPSQFGHSSYHTTTYYSAPPRALPQQLHTNPYVQTSCPRPPAVSCTSAQVWLKLFAANGEYCYAGDGSLAVSLQNVTHGQVVGKRQACFTTSGSTVKCVAGPTTFSFNPPADIRYITLRS